MRMGHDHNVLGSLWFSFSTEIIKVAKGNNYNIDIPSVTHQKYS